MEGLPPWAYGALVAVEVRVTTGRRELPYAGSRSCKAELPNIASGIEHLSCAHLSRMCECHCCYQIEGVPSPGFIGQAIVLAFPQTSVAVAEVLRPDIRARNRY